MAFQFNPFNNSFDIVSNPIEQDAQRTFYFRNITVQNGDPQYTVESANPVDYYGNPFFTPQNTNSFITNLGARILTKNVSVAPSTNPQFRIMRQGVVPGAGNISNGPDIYSNMFSINVNTNSSVFYVNQIQSASSVYVGPATSVIIENQRPQLVLATAPVGGTFTFTADFFGTLTYI